MLDIKKITPEVIRKTYNSFNPVYPFFTKGDYNLNFGVIRSNNRVADAFDDIIYVVYKKNGKETIFKCWATVDPGLDHLLYPIFPEAQKNGSAIVAEGFYQSMWVIGEFYGKKALLPTKPIRVYRDTNRDKNIDLNPNTLQWGNFGILVHDHMQAVETATRVGRTSAGCFSPQTRHEMELLIAICEMGLKTFPYPLSMAVLAENQLVF